MNRITQQLSYLNAGRLYYTDFIVATLDKKRILDEEMLYIVFKSFDTNNQGFIT